MARKFRGALPDGVDAVVAACEVRAGMWLLDPETGEWGNVKQAGRANVCVGFGGVRTWRVSLRKLGAREFAVDEPVTVRVAAPMPEASTHDADTEPDEPTTQNTKGTPVTGHIDRDAAVDAVLAVMDGHIERESHRVYEWPEDEADLHRNGGHGSFTERAAAVSRLRAEKIVDAVLRCTTARPPVFTEAQARSLADLQDVPTFEPPNTRAIPRSEGNLTDAEVPDNINRVMPPAGGSS